MHAWSRNVESLWLRKENISRNSSFICVNWDGHHHRMGSMVCLLYISLTNHRCDMTAPKRSTIQCASRELHQNAHSDAYRFVPALTVHVPRLCAKIAENLSMHSTSTLSPQLEPQSRRCRASPRHSHALWVRCGASPQYSRILDRDARACV